EPYGPLNWRSIKTAQPASLPPGVAGSGGIMRSTMASIALASSAVKNCQGPGRSAWGADDGNGAHGMWSRMTEARVSDVVPANQIAAETRNLRRCNIAPPEKRLNFRCFPSWEPSAGTLNWNQPTFLDIC